MSGGNRKKGFVLLHRSLLDHWIWRAEKFTKAQAWIDLILLACHSDRQVMTRGVLVSLARGQVGASKVFLAERWKWSRPSVDRYIARLESVHMIEVSQNVVGTVITVLNYDGHQSAQRKRAGNVTPNVTGNVTGNVTSHVAHLNNLKQLNELKEDDSFFE